MSELKMPTINQVAVSGRLVQDPEFRITEHGSARLSARLACNRSYRDRAGQWQEEASFFNIVVWLKLAEYYADRLKKGSPILVVGRLRSHSWKDDDDTPHSIVEIQVRSLQLLEKSQNTVDPEEPSETEMELELAN